MPSPLTTKRNKYYKNRKSNDIETPPGVSQFLYDLISPHMKKRVICDVGCGRGNLIRPWVKDYKTILIDKDMSHATVTGNAFFEMDFLASWNWPKGAYQAISKQPIPDLILCNPPFNQKSGGRKLMPELFLKAIFDFWGERVPTVLFSPMGFRLNQRVKSERYKHFRDECEAEITTIISMPLDAFPNVEFHNEILIWNFFRLRTHYWMPEKYLVDKAD